MLTRDQIAFKQQKVHRVLPCPSPKHSFDGIARPRSEVEALQATRPHPRIPPHLEPPPNEAAPSAEEPSSRQGTSLAGEPNRMQVLPQCLSFGRQCLCTMPCTRHCQENREE